MKKRKTACIIGATGLVGQALVETLIQDSNFSNIRIFVRRKSRFQNPKVEEHIIDFEQSETYSDLVTGDVLFSCMGTTRRKAGSKDAQYRVDYTYQLKFAQFAKKAGIPTYVLVSSTGANSKSKFFYSRIKGELEKAVTELNFEKTIIVQPSILRGEREEHRAAETWSANVIDRVSHYIKPLRKYRSITGKEVAQAMIRINNEENTEKLIIRKLDELV